MFERKRKNIKNTAMNDDDDTKASALLEMLNIFSSTFIGRILLVCWYSCYF
jgi:hypothetical protein